MVASSLLVCHLSERLSCLIKSSLDAIVNWVILLCCGSFVNHLQTLRLLNFSAIGQDEREKCCQIMEGTVGKSLWAADITVEEMDKLVIQIDDSSDDE